MNRSSKILFGLGFILLLMAIPVAIEYVVSMLPPSGLSDAVSTEQERAISATGAMWTLCLRMAALFLLIAGVVVLGAGFVKHYDSKKIVRGI